MTSWLYFWQWTFNYTAPSCTYHQHPLHLPSLSLLVSLLIPLSTQSHSSPLCLVFFPHTSFFLTPLSSEFCVSSNLYMVYSFHGLCSPSLTCSHLPSCQVIFPLSCAIPRLSLSHLLFALLWSTVFSSPILSKMFLLFMWLFSYHFKTDFEWPHHQVIICQVNQRMFTSLI